MPASAAAASLRRDVTVTGLVTGAHCFSHYFILGVPATFVLIHKDMGLSFLELGLLATVFSVFSGVGQFVTGVYVDRIGGWRVLIGGMTLLAVSVLGIGLAPYYGLMLVLAAFAGIGNSVFHPADYSIMSATVAPARMGRAFAVHTFGGYIGFALGPVCVIGLAEGAGLGWRTALVVSGAVALGVVALLFSQRKHLAGEIAPAATGPAKSHAAEFRSAFALVLTAPFVLMFGFYTLSGGISIGLSGTVPKALNSLFGTPVAAAAIAVSALSVGGACGTLIGGWVADRLKRFDLVTGIGYGTAAAIMVAIASVKLPGLAVVGGFALAGFMLGSVTPSRDLMVRSITPKGSSGKVFGFVASGFDVGGAIFPPIVGALLDAGMPAAVFFAAAATMVMAFLFSAAAMRARRPAAPPAPVAAE
jgi:MFS family permease